MTEAEIQETAARLGARRRRQPLRLSPVMLSPVMLSPVMLSPVMLSPVMLSPVMLSPGDVAALDALAKALGRSRSDLIREAVRRVC